MMKNNTSAKAENKEEDNEGGLHEHSDHYYRRNF